MSPRIRISLSAALLLACIIEPSGASMKHPSRFSHKKLRSALRFSKAPVLESNPGADSELESENEGWLANLLPNPLIPQKERIHSSSIPGQTGNPLPPPKPAVNPAESEDPGNFEIQPMLALKPQIGITAKLNF